MGVSIEFIKPQNLASKFNESVTGGSNIFTDDIVVDEDCILRITACFAANAVLTAVITRGTTTVTVNFNEGNALVANSVYAFDLPMRSGDKLNLRVDVDTTAKILNVDLIRIAI